MSLMNRKKHQTATASWISYPFEWLEMDSGTSLSCFSFVSFSQLWLSIVQHSEESMDYAIWKGQFRIMIIPTFVFFYSCGFPRVDKHLQIRELCASNFLFLFTKVCAMYRCNRLWRDLSDSRRWCVVTLFEGKLLQHWEPWKLLFVSKLEYVPVAWECQRRVKLSRSRSWSAACFYLVPRPL